MSSPVPKRNKHFKVPTKHSANLMENIILDSLELHSSRIDSVRVERRDCGLDIHVARGDGRSYLSRCTVKAPVGAQDWRLLTVQTPIYWLDPDDYRSDRAARIQMLMESINRTGYLAAAVLLPGEEWPKLMSQFWIAPQDLQAAEKLYYPQALASAMFVAELLEGPSRAGLFDTEMAWQSKMAAEASQSRHSKHLQKEFLALSKVMAHHRLVHTLGERSITCEFPLHGGDLPLKGGGASCIQGDETSLLTITADLKHPSGYSVLGIGLKVPSNGNALERRALSERLNLAELRAKHQPPFAGAWSAHPRIPCVQYLSHWPNFMPMPNPLSAAYAWALKRSTWVVKEIGG